MPQAVRLTRRVATGRKNFIAKSAVRSAMTNRARATQALVRKCHAVIWGRQAPLFHPTPVAMRLKCQCLLEDLSANLTVMPFQSLDFRNKTPPGRDRFKPVASGLLQIEAQLHGDSISCFASLHTWNLGHNKKCCNDSITPRTQAKQ